MLLRLSLTMTTIFWVSLLAGPNASAVDLISTTTEVVQSEGTESQTLTARNLPFVGESLVRSSCANEGVAGQEDPSNGKKLLAAARYCRKVVLAEKHAMRGAAMKAARRIARAKTRFERAWDRITDEAMAAEPACTAPGEDFSSVANTLRRAASKYPTLIGTDLDLQGRAGRVCASKRIHRTAHLCGGLLKAESHHQNDPERLETAQIRLQNRFDRRWARLSSGCADANVADAASNATSSIVDTAVSQITSVDTDGDGIGDLADTDDDDDGWLDELENACETDPLNASSVPEDSDADASCDLVDTDDDNDGVADDLDPFPLDAAETLDTDGDGVGDNADTDDDGDGWTDESEVSCETDPLVASSVPDDYDGDLICDAMDADADGNGARDDVTSEWMTIDFEVGEVVEYEGKELTPICSFGTPYAFFAREGTVNKLLVYYQGGGAGWNGLTIWATAYDVFTVFNAAIETDPEASGSDHPSRARSGIANLDDPKNPFADWHVVFVSYCTGDVHWGDNVKNYVWGDTEIEVHHKGAHNAMVAEKWIREHFSGPEEVFVTGSSAGAYGAVTHAVGLMEAYPDSNFRILGDAGNGVVTQEFLVGYLSNWGLEKNLPEEIPELNVPLGELQMSGVYEAIARHYPDARFATYTTAFDGGIGGQTYFYNLMKHGEDFASWLTWWDSSCEWNQIMRELNFETASEAPNFRYYIGSGSAHTILGREKLYTDTTGGVPIFADWIDTMMYGNEEEWKNVECTDCGYLLPGDPGPDEPTAPFGEFRIACPGTP